MCIFTCVFTYAHRKYYLSHTKHSTQIHATLFVNCDCIDNKTVHCTYMDGIIIIIVWFVSSQSAIISDRFITLICERKILWKRNEDGWQKTHTKQIFPFVITTKVLKRKVRQCECECGNDCQCNEQKMKRQRKKKLRKKQKKMKKLEMLHSVNESEIVNCYAFELVLGRFRHSFTFHWWCFHYSTIENVVAFLFIYFKIGAFIYRSLLRSTKKNRS